MASSCVAVSGFAGRVIFAHRAWFRVGCLLACGWLVSVGVLGAEPDAVEGERLPLPEASARAAVEPKLREIYRDALAGATTAESRTQLAEQLLADAGEIADDPAARYVLLEWAGSQAAAAADPELLRKVLATAVAEFEVESVAWYLAALGETPEKLRGAEACRRLAEDIMSMINSAITAEQFDVAEQLLLAAAKLQGKARSPQLTRAVGEQRTLLVAARRTWEQAEKATATLAERPDDPTANLALGRYLCLTRGDWEAGLPLLAKGDDAVLSPLARQSLEARPDTPEAQATLAGQWWDAAVRSRGNATRYRDLLGGVRYWYTLAQPGLSGIEAKLAGTRLAEADKVLGPSAAIVSSTPPANTVVDPAKMSPTLTLPLGPRVELVLRLVPAGTFTMGSPQGELGKEPDERPHEVTISRPFYVGQYEVTRAQWTAVTGRPAPHGADQLRRPVNGVSWDDAADFCARLNAQLAGRALVADYLFRLPTEAEWEYACRAGTTTATHYGDQLSSAQAWFDGTQPYNGAPPGVNAPYNDVRDVGSFQPNAWGLFDMHGNVQEWCLDWLGDYSFEPVSDPVGPSTGQQRVIRGGGYRSSGALCRSANRAAEAPQRTTPSRGFRIVYGPRIEAAP